MTLGIPNDIWLNTPKEGDEIVVFDQNAIFTQKNDHELMLLFKYKWQHRDPTTLDVL